jgi:hypothetical protein
MFGIGWRVAAKPGATASLWRANRPGAIGSPKSMPTPASLCPRRRNVTPGSWCPRSGLDARGHARIADPFKPNPPCPGHIHRVGGCAEFPRAVSGPDPLGPGPRHPEKQSADQSDTRGASWRYLLKGTPRLIRCVHPEGGSSTESWRDPRGNRIKRYSHLYECRLRPPDTTRTTYPSKPSWQSPMMSQYK